MQNQPVMGGIQAMPSNPMLPTQMQPQMQMQMQPMQAQMIATRTPSQNFMVGQQQNFQQKRRLSKTQKHPTVSTPAQYSPQPAATPPQPAMTPQQPPPPVSDFHQIGELVEQLSEEQQDLLFELFECAKAARRPEEKAEKFIAALTQKKIGTFPNGVAMVSMVIDQIRSGGEFCQFVKDPPVPMVFQKRKQTRSTFRLLLSNPTTIEISIPQKVRKDVDTYVIAYAYSNTENVLVTSLQCERMEIPPLYFGESRPVYVLARPGRQQQKLQIQVALRSSHFAWLVVSYVARTPVDFLVKELFKIPQDQETPQYTVKTNNCRPTCAFDAVSILEAIGRDGGAVCPMCSTPVMLSELKSELRPVVMPTAPPVRQPEVEPQRPIVLEDDPETKEARPMLYEQLTTLLKPDAISVLSSALFESNGLDCEGLPPFELKGTDDYFHDLHL